MKQKKLLALLMAVCMVLALLPSFAVAETTTVTDTLTRETTGVTGTSYATWTYSSTASGVTYAGYSAGGNSSIQLNNKNNYGIVTTVSGGKAKEIEVTWDSNTANDRTLDVYGNNTAYTDTSDLYGSNAGTKIGSIVIGPDTKLTIADDYAYIGLRSNNGALYLTSITITWEKDGDTPQPDTYTVTLNPGEADGTPVTVEDVTSPYTLPACPFTAPEGKEFDCWKIDGGETEYGVGATVTLSANTTFVAQWKDAPVAETKKYVKVTEAPEDWSGEYLIVYEEGALVFDSSRESLDAGQNGVSVTIVDSTITTESKYAFTIAAVEGGYSIKSSSGKYIGQSRWDNGMLVNSTYSNNYLNTIGLDVDGNAVISGQGVSNDTHVTLRYNSNTGATNERFRYYKSGQQSIALYKLVEDEPETLEDGFYLIGQNGWTVDDIDATQKFGANVNAGGEYILAATLAAGDQIKVVKVANGAITAWYPDGMDNQYTVDAAHAGNVNIYFRETYNSDWSVFGGYFYIEAGYNITCVSGEHGLVSTTHSRATEGTTVTIYLEAEDDYEVDTLTVMCGGTEVETNKVNDWQYTFSMPAGDVTITATFAIPSTEPYFRGHELILDGLIGLSFNMELPEISDVDYTTSYMTFSIAHGECTESAGYNEDASFVCYVNAIQMAEPITATFHYMLNNTEKTVKETYSVEDYFTAFDKVASKYDKTTVALVHAVADYGYHAQRFLSEQRGWTLGTDFAEMTEKYTANYDTDTINAIKTAVENYKFQSVKNDDVEKITYSLIFDSATEIRVFFKMKSGYTGSFTAGSPYEATKAGARYQISVLNIPAHLLSKTYAITATTDSEGTVSATVSALSYVRSLLANYTDTNSQNAAASVYAYSQAANAYKAAH